MSSIAELCLVFGGVFLASFVAAKALTRHKRVDPKRLCLFPDQRVRLLCSSGSYRCHVARVEKDGILITPPIHRDAYVPLRVGDELIAQVPQPDALLTFRTQILRRDASDHTFLLSLPQRFRKTERRRDARDLSLKGEAARVNGRSGQMSDLSAHGARLVTLYRPDPGERVLIELPSDLPEQFAYVLESLPAFLDGHPAQELRLRFEEPLRPLLGRHLRTS
ncbi:MAG: flagellar brake protein [Armatimonadetes bacterium]|nr:flagellar brake protein [Armatimonadota bacterium]